MSSKSRRNYVICVSLVITLFTANVVFADDNVPIPGDKNQLNNWFNQNVKPLSQRKDTLDPALIAAENAASTINAAIKNIPTGNTKRVIVYIGSGTYVEKIKMEREKPFITLYGAPGSMPNLTYGGTALKYGTVDSATLIVESDYFVAMNMIISNSAPKPDGKRKGAQTLALRAFGDKATFYKVTLHFRIHYVMMHIGIFTKIA
ncbi:putative pectinesterase [Lupinus albus]|uniref:pectinesterase n=1 Tax=Lupinus albus TaxID=3870 RepID=A0A6A4NPP6_LUPAL|nr:putative pectinesterase [Lupinus albus]